MGDSGKLLDMMNGMQTSLRQILQRQQRMEAKQVKCVCVCVSVCLCVCVFVFERESVRACVYIRAFC
jgi:hypothetical protein